MKVSGVIITNLFINFSSKEFTEKNNISNLARAINIIQKFQDAGADKYLVSPFFIDRVYLLHKDNKQIIEKVEKYLKETSNNKEFLEKVSNDEELKQELENYMKYIQELFSNPEQYEISFTRGDLLFLKNILENVENISWGSKTELASFYAQILKELGE